MPVDPINRAYARALFEMASAERALSRVEDDLYWLSELLKGNPELLQFLKDPQIRREAKRSALSELFENRVHALLLNWLLTLSDQERTRRILPIISDYRVVSDEARDRVAGEVVTAVSLNEETLERLAAALSRATGKNVQLFHRVDPAIVGGAIIKVGDEIVDGSLRRKLDQIKAEIIK